MRGIYNRRGKYSTNDLQDDQVVIVINAPGELIIQPGHPQHLTCTRYQGYCNIIMVTTGEWPRWEEVMKKEMEAFTAWEDRRRAMELPSSPVTTTIQEIQEVHLLDDRPRRLFQEDAVFVMASIGEKWPLDGVLEGVKGLCNMVAK